MVTTIKVTRETKALLDQMKQHKQTYDELIAELAHNKQHSTLREELIKGYQEEDMEEFYEWENANL